MAVVRMARGKKTAAVVNDWPVKVMDVSIIDFASWNYKIEDEERAAELVASMRRSGYVSKMVVAEREEEPGAFEVIDGNHRLVAVRAMNIDSLQVIFGGPLSKRDRMLIGVQLNELHFVSDPVRLSDTVHDICELSDPGDLGDIMSTLPYTQDEFMMMVGGIELFNEYESDITSAEADNQAKTKSDVTKSIHFNLTASVYNRFRSVMNKMSIDTDDDIVTALLDAYEGAE